VKGAFFRSPDDASGDLGAVKLDVWAATEGDFYAAVRALADESLAASAIHARSDQLRNEFLKTIERSALDVFDRWCPGAGLDVEALRRRVIARYQLSSALRGYSKFGEGIFAALGVAPPEGGKAARAARKTSRKREKSA
jgi:hypothetical protein